ncbi:hypothetical protein LCL85_12460 [Vibrio alginolyticus]|nr:hypothetical protein [Vibrio alginolyticus]
MNTLKKSISLMALVSIPYMATAATITVDADSGKFSEVEKVIDMATISSDSPIADKLVKNNGDVKVAAVYLIESLNGDIKGLWQAVDGTTKINSTVSGPSPTECGNIEYKGGSRFPDDGNAQFSQDGAILAAEIELKVRGSSTYDRFVGVWKVLPDGNKGGDFKAPVILCDIDTLNSVKGSSQNGEYVVVGTNTNKAMDRVYTVKR